MCLGIIYNFVGFRASAPLLHFTWLIPEVKKYNYGFMAMQIWRLHSLAFKIIKKIKNGVFQYLASCAHGKRLEN